MYIVYILKSETFHSKHYVGITQNLEKRLKEHNNDRSIYTKKYTPWRIETFITFSNQERAIKFEKYLKEGSGHAFLKKRLI
jgi:putative endonuclease